MQRSPAEGGDCSSQSIEQEIQGNAASEEYPARSLWRCPGCHCLTVLHVPIDVFIATGRGLPIGSHLNVSKEGLLGRLPDLAGKYRPDPSVQCSVSQSRCRPLCLSCLQLCERIVQPASRSENSATGFPEQTRRDTQFPMKLAHNTLFLTRSSLW
ncbi:Hypothetical predicted protein [Pelobates cultripes]|nr:Hypothetical predicted protein [Pelobates cultripes]